MAALQRHAAVSRWHPVELVICDCHKNNDATVIDTRSLNKAKRHLHRHKVLSHNLHNITAHIDAIVTTINFYLSRLVVHKCWEFTKFHCFTHAFKKIIHKHYWAKADVTEGALTSQIDPSLLHELIIQWQFGTAKRSALHWSEQSLALWGPSVITPTISVRPA